MAKFIPKFLHPVLNYVPNETVQELTSYASKAIRAKIIADRYTRGFEKANRDGGREAYEFETAKPALRTEKQHQKYIKEVRDGKEIENEGYISEEAGRLSRASDKVNHYITLVDIDSKEDGQNKWEGETEDPRSNRYYSYIQLPFVPSELAITPESSFVGIASFGRNNPYYQFTGSEDTLVFTIDWHSNRLDRKDVIFNCRWVEALTKGDGYMDVPHRIKLVWGETNPLFKDATWIVVSAPYTLTQFIKAYRDPEDPEKIVDVGMLPQQAIQIVTLKRVTPTNLTSNQIIGNNYR